MPGVLIAAARHNRPTIIVYGGTIQVGTRHVDCPSMGFKKGGTVNIADAYESYGTMHLILSFRDTYGHQVHMRLVSSTTRNGLTWSGIPAPVRVLVVGCTREWIHLNVFVVRKPCYDNAEQTP